MAITAAQVNELRQKTGAGMMDCKKALTESNGDFEKAIEILRKKGAAVATKRAEKSANEGLILTKISADKKTGFMVEINCETDFVAKSEDFIKLAEAVLNAVQTDKPTSVQELLEKNTNVKNHLTDVMGKIGEKIEISRFDIVNAPDGIVALGKDIAMQVAAMKPICVYREEVPSDVVNKELEIYKELSRKEGKPEQILEKIALGRLNKFYQENCLAEQAFIKDNAKSVSDLLKEFNSKHGSQIKIGLFKRFHLSDEKK
jgi:elongation factor Ts